MSSLRLVLVTRRFWPLVGGAERIMAGLGAEFAGRVGAVTILTARWQPQWPPEITFRGVPPGSAPQPLAAGLGHMAVHAGSPRLA